ncbi:MAG: ParB/RepB/Spo0J family partition protein [Gammaproteobacteria bacterium]
MPAKKRGLGKGLDALLGLQSADNIPATGHINDELRALPVDMVQRSAYQPRTEFNQAALEELASSIRAQGVVQPIVVRPVSNGKHEIIAGERRWRAAQLAGLHEVPVVVRKVNDLEAMCLALIENIQREDLSPLEEARGIARLLDEFDMTHDMIAEAVGRSRSTISNMLRLLELAVPVRQMLEQRELEMGHARALLSLGQDQQSETARLIVSKRLSVRETEALVRNLLNKTGVKKTGKKTVLDPNIRSLQDELSGRLGTAVVIKHNKSGKGALEIRYSSVDELDGILSRIK